MKLTIYSNYLNHHQLPLCLEFYKYLGGGFVFCVAEPVPQTRLDVGWDNMNDHYSFVLKRYESKENEAKALELAESSDVVILDDCSDLYKRIRVKNRKFFFRESERIFKKRLKIIHIFKIIREYGGLWHWHHTEKNGYLLCNSAYAYRDFFSFGCYWNRALKFGYFPSLPEININDAYKEKETNSFIWVGRFIKWKHPEYMIKLASSLKTKNINFRITMLGDGELFNDIKQQIIDNSLENYINLVGAVNHKEVSKYMIKCQFHLFTSNREEGWGAVLNESMNCGCIPIGNKKIGSVPYLIKNKHNGFIYNNSYKSFEKMILKAIRLNDNVKYQLAINAHNTIKDEWNAKEAAKEIIRISQCKLNRGKVKFKKCGVMSKAKI